MKKPFYIQTWHPDGYPIALHILIAERALGRKLPKGADVHHVNGDKRDNRPSNLVICPDRAYHMLLHRRQRALEACGNPNWMKCPHCKQWDDPANLYAPPLRQDEGAHPACRLAYKRRKRAINRSRGDVKSYA